MSYKDPMERRETAAQAEAIPDDLKALRDGPLSVTVVRYDDDEGTKPVYRPTVFVSGLLDGWWVIMVYSPNHEGRVMQGITDSGYPAKREKGFRLHYREIMARPATEEEIERFRAAGRIESTPASALASSPPNP